jgi:hypothetical protein
VSFFEVVDSDILEKDNPEKQPPLPQLHLKNLPALLYQAASNSLEPYDTPAGQEVHRWQFLFVETAISLWTVGCVHNKPHKQYTSSYER